MIIKLKKLYSNPEVFTPIDFHTGVNIILGEEVENSSSIQDRKNNGVGKSMSIEFINFCLLKKYNESRVSLIPDNVFIEPPIIILDLELNSVPLSIYRDIKNPDNITILQEGSKKVFDKLNDAREYINSFVQYNSISLLTPTFREILSPIIRDEKTGFNDIVQTNSGNGNNIPLNFRPHLYFLGINIEIYEKIKSTLDEIKEVSTSIKTIRKGLGCTTKKAINEERAILNALNDEVFKMKNTIETFKSMDAFRKIQDEIVTIEAKLDVLKVQRKSLKSEIGKIETIPNYEDIDDEEITLIYEFFKEGLGDKISKSLEQVKSFKKKVDDFQKSLIKERYNNLNLKLDTLNRQIENLDDIYSKKIKIIDEKGVLKDIKVSFKVYDQKNEELSEKRYKLSEYDKNCNKKDSLETQKDDYLISFRALLEEKNQELKSFEDTILDMHETIMGNKEASFRIETTKNKSVLDFDLRIKDDGSYSNNRTKVFIYDLSLMFNKYTRINHPHFLIHDNIFQIDNDTLIRCLNQLEKFSSYKDDFQYIFTINKDLLELNEIKNNLQLNIKESTVACFTKEKQFLRKSYREKR